MTGCSRVRAMLRMTCWVGWPLPRHWRDWIRTVDEIDPVLREFILRSHHAHRDRQQLEEARLRQERDVAFRMSSLLLADRARQATQTDDCMTGILLALAALPDCGPGGQRPFVQEAGLALQEAIARNRERLCLAHEGAVRHAAFSPDGARIVTASATTRPRGCGTPATGKQLATLAGHEDAVCSARSARTARASSPRQRRQDRAGVGRGTGKQLATLAGHEDRRDAARVQPGRRAHRHRVSETRPRGCGTRRRASSSPRSRDMRMRVRQRAFSPDGARIVTASTTRPRGCGTRRRASSSPRSRGMSDSV